MRHSTMLLMIALTTIAAKRPPEISWGRAGVSFDTYRSDAITCGRLGANTDIADEPATAAFVAAERATERNLNAPMAGVDTNREQAMIVQRLRPAERIAEVQNVHLSVTERCLTRLGYRRFILTNDQVRALRRLPIGTAARHDYLHTLASDDAVLTAQAMPASGKLTAIIRRPASHPRPSAPATS